MDHDTPFEPLNDLEVRLLQAQDGTLSAAQFLDGLLTSTAFVLLDKAIGEDGAWDESISPLVLTSESGEPMFAVFTAPERAGLWHEQLPQFAHAMPIAVHALLAGIGDGVGLVLNPGLDVGMEMIPDAVAQLKQRAAAITRGMAH
ncbi:SseB family protein [Stenotrophomonas maltophilia]|uniref:SseB family protein n=1 Tax=Stenotrophomonas maltophilia TaxID=40324 RepID=UPI001310F041|nr:SseB family protein [Stenotrophomonas maltophilia]MDG2510662.1 SseB family protein [Stenotrophomonas maltophilia]